jgi:transposase
MNRGRTKEERLAQEAIRPQVVKRIVAGESISELARMLGYARQTLHRWFAEYEVGGMPALESTKASGAVAKLTEKQTSGSSRHSARRALLRCSSRSRSGLEKSSVS